MIDLTGRKFGRWIVRKRVPNHGRNPFWLCICSCGTEKEVNGSSLRHAQSQSCGCLARERISAAVKTHGVFGTAEYSIYHGMKQRCYDARRAHYKNYGGRGIRVCQRWLESFENFFEDMGPRPSPGHSIERKDNNGNYDPNNCKWATQSEQSRNMRNSRMVFYSGRSMPMVDACALAGFSYDLVSGRLYSGWSDQKALSTPIRKKRKSV